MTSEPILRIEVQVRCEDCDGVGLARDDGPVSQPVKCSRCDGCGVVRVEGKDAA